jgi:hypothetical protein
LNPDFAEQADRETALVLSWQGSRFLRSHAHFNSHSNAAAPI